MLNTLYRHGCTIFSLLYNALSFVFCCCTCLRKKKPHTHEQRLDAFYKQQASYYDETRIHFLLGRKEMIQSAVQKLQNTQSENLIWIDVGCGTGQLVDFLSQEQRQMFARIILVDCCESLLQEARAKKRKNMWHNVEIVHCNADDLLAPFAAQQLNNAVDLITFSYSLSMMIDWMGPLQHASKLLRAGTGVLACCDYYCSQSYATPFALGKQAQQTSVNPLLLRILVPWMLAINHVYTQRDYLPYLVRHFDACAVHESYFWMPYFAPIFPLPIYQYVGTAKK